MNIKNSLNTSVAVLKWTANYNTYDGLDDTQSNAVV